MERDTLTVGIIGAGSWGQALGRVIERAGNDVRLAGRGDDPRALLDRDVLLLVVPAQETRAVLAAMAPDIPDGLPLVLCAKGVERDSGMLMPELVAEETPAAVACVLSGPNFAAEIAQGLPAAATLACADLTLAERLATRLTPPDFRLYASDDPIGAALGGACKNVLAIAAGAVAGAGLGANARAALIARGLAELRRLGRALGARDETLVGLSGLGDIVLSCTDPTSRNYRFGHALASGSDAPSSLVEGVHSVSPLLQRAALLGVEMPIVEAVNDVLHLGTPLPDAIAALLARPGGRE
ncbi:MAG: NAD(P)H-dependent glycerol-3-phosphate dehydrogenase [Pseudomonadota bacterium]|nr:NAD(P)H-dependent glycerol-3-phosphate dehydrogenase [Pseudomonadota bacterium]